MVLMQFPLWQSGYRCYWALVTQRWGIPNSFSKIHLTFLNSASTQMLLWKCQWPEKYSTHLSVTDFAFRFHHQWNRRSKCRLVGSEVKSPLSQISSKPPCSHTHHLKLLVASHIFTAVVLPASVTEREALFPSLPRCTWVAALPYSIVVVLPNLVLSANLLRVQYSSLSRPLIKTSNTIDLSVCIPEGCP